MTPDDVRQLVWLELEALDQSVSLIDWKVSEIRAKIAEGAPCGEIFWMTAHLRRLAEVLQFKLVDLRESLGEQGFQSSWSEVLKSNSKKVAK